MFHQRRFVIIGASFALVAAFGIRPVASAPVSITVHRSTPVSADAMGDPHAESFLAIDPKDDKTMLATSSAIEDGALRDVLYVTHDGGRVWRRHRFAAADPIIEFDGGDPTVYFDPQGRGYFIVMGHSGFTLTSSDDGGNTWTRGVHSNVMESFDRNYFAFDATGRYRGRMYAWGDVAVHPRDRGESTGLAVVTSLDRGKTFGPIRVIAASDHDPYPMLGPVDLVVAPDGTLVMPIAGDSLDLMNRKRHVAMGELYNVTSSDGGTTLSKAKPIVRFHERVGDPDRVEGWGGIPRTAIDLSSGPYRGRIYLLYVDAKAGGNDIFVTHSSNNGQTWLAPAKVNDGNVPNGNANPAIAVNSDGVVGVIWNDRRANPSSLCYQLYISASVDGGTSFEPNVRARSKATCPTAPGNFKPAAISQDFPKGVKLIDLLMVPTRWSNGGDTQGLAASNDGVFHAVWIDGESGVMQIEQTDFSVGGSVDRSGLLGAGNVFPPAKPPAASVVGDQVKVEIVDRRIDMAAGKISLTVRLRNSSQLTIDGPLSLVFQHLQGNLPRFRAVNADNGISGKNADWNFERAGSALPPNAVTQTREIEFVFDRLPSRPTYPVIFFEVHGK